MAEVIIVCGIICSGKSSYCERIRAQYNAVKLSVDEIYFNIIKKDLYTREERIQIEEKMQLTKNLHEYIVKKAEQIVLCGTNVIFEVSYYKNEAYENLKKQFSDKNINVSLHYVHVSNEQWIKNINKRNKEIDQRISHGTYIENEFIPIVEKQFKEDNVFEKPQIDKIDVLFYNIGV